MTTNNELELNHLGLIVLGVVLMIAGAGVLAAEPPWIVSPVGAGAALTAAGITLIITTVGRRRREQREEVVVDERITTITEKAGYRAFQVTFITQGVVFAVVGVTAIDLPLNPILGGLFALTAAAYTVAYNRYRTEM